MVAFPVSLAYLRASETRESSRHQFATSALTSGSLHGYHPLLGGTVRLHVGILDGPDITPASGRSDIHENLPLDPKAILL